MSLACTALRMESKPSKWFAGMRPSWGIAPNRIGFMGFSAGAMVTTRTLLQEDAASRPNFAAPI